MVTKMSKLSVLLYHGEREKFLQELRDLGVVHIEYGDKDLSESAAAINLNLSEMRKVIADIKTSHKTAPKSSETTNDIESKVKEYLQNLQRTDAIANEILAISKEKKRFEPWGDVEPKVLEKLSENNVFVSLYELSQRDKPLLEGLTYEIVKETAGSIFVAVVGKDKPVLIDGKETTILPQTSLADLERQEANLCEERQAIAKSQEQTAKYLTAIEAYEAKLMDSLNYEIASNSMSTAAKEKVLYVNAWTPTEKKAKVQNLLNDFSCWYEFDEPKEDESVPVQFNNNAYANKYETITRLFALPKYREIDPTPFFAPFYMIFFGFCLGDVGYGALVVLLATVMYLKASEKLKPIATLGIMLGFSTMFAGFLLNGFFGVPIFDSADGTGIFSGSEFVILALLKTVYIDTPTGQTTLMPMIPFAIFLGIFQILFAMCLRAANRLKRSNFNIQYALYPLGTIFLTIAATMAVTKINFLNMGSLFQVLFGFTSMQVYEFITPTMILTPMIAGLVLLFLFNNPQKPIHVRVPLGLWELYQFATGLMGDGLSYIRLFALGLAGGLLAASFNQIAFMILPNGDMASPLIVFTVIILLLGHGINFLLAMLGSFVHPLRLTFVEFYKHIEFQGGAKEYKPFAKTELTKAS